MFKRRILKTLLSSKLKGVPEEQQDLIFDLIEKNPELFKKIGEEIQTAIANGEDQMQASMRIMNKYKDSIQEALKN